MTTDEWGIGGVREAGVSGSELQELRGSGGGCFCVYLGGPSVASVTGWAWMHVGVRVMEEERQKGRREGKEGEGRHRQTDR